MLRPPWTDWPVASPDCPHDNSLKLGWLVPLNSCFLARAAPPPLCEDRGGNVKWLLSRNTFFWSQRFALTPVASGPERSRYRVCLSVAIILHFLVPWLPSFPVGAWRGTVEPNNPRPLWPPHSLFTLLLIQHQMVMDSHRTSMESVFSTRQCLWGTQMEANVVVSAFRLCRLTGRDHRDTRKRMSHRYLTGGEVKQDAYCRYMGRWRHAQGVAFHFCNIVRLTVLRCKGNWWNRTRGIFFLFYSKHSP